MSVFQIIDSQQVDESRLKNPDQTTFLWAYEKGLRKTCPTVLIIKTCPTVLSTVGQVLRSPFSYVDQQYQNRMCAVPIT